MSESQKLELKILTLSAWANHLLGLGMISIEKHRQMISAIQQLKK